MRWYKRPKCWITRHHWLLQDNTEPLPFFNPDDNVFIYYYQCQVCNAKLFQEVEHL